jgi:predicted MFS family arabinose efflux permease
VSSGSEGGIRAALRIRDFRLLLGGQIVSGTGDWLYNIALVVFVLDATGSGAWVAAASLVRFLPYVLFGTFGGMIADRYDRKRVMILADLARAVVMTALTIVAATEGSPLAAIALAGLSTVFSTAHYPAVQASTPVVVGEDDLAAANTLVSTVDNVALALGPAIGGVLLLLGSPVVAFGVNAATFVVSALLSAGIRTSLRPEGAAEAEDSFGERLSEGFRAIGSSSTVKVLLALSLGFTIFYGQEIVLYALAAEELFDIGDDGLSFLWASIGIGGILAAGFTHRVAARPRQIGIMATVSVISGIPIIVLAFVHAPAAVYPLVAIEGGTAIVADVIFMTLMQRTVPGEVLGRVFGILDSLMVAGIMVGTVLAPVLVSAIGLQASMVVAGLSIVLIVGLAFPKARQVDREAVARAADLAERIALLERTEIFEGASRPTIEGLAASAVLETVPASTVVIREGDPADDLFVVASGRFRVTVRGEDGRESELGELGPEDHFGEIGVLERLPRTATVTAATEATAYRIGGDDFLRAVSEPPRMSGRLVSTVATRLRRTHPEHPAASRHYDASQ